MMIWWKISFVSRITRARPIAIFVTNYNVARLSKNSIDIVFGIVLSSRNGLNIILKCNIIAIKIMEFTKILATATKRIASMRGMRIYIKRRFKHFRRKIDRIHSKWKKKSALLESNRRHSDDHISTVRRSTTELRAALIIELNYFITVLNNLQF